MRRRGRDAEGTTRLFFAADIHGSEPTWRKFVNAARFYDVDVLVFGGDLMGKALVPIVREGGRLRASWRGEPVALEPPDLTRFTRAIEVAGHYWTVMDPDEYATTASDPWRQRGLVLRLATERLGRWLSYAEDHLSGTQVRLFVTGGNDDEPAVLEVLDRHEGERVVACEGRVVAIDGEHTMLTVGLSTPTPWDTPREASEDEIAAAIESQVERVSDLSRCVFNLHCPPLDCPLDLCVKLERVEGGPPQPVRQGPRFAWTHGGSRSVREAVRRHQPLAGLHGHIHEAPGRYRLGRTPCFNPGSEYEQGLLQGWIVILRGSEVVASQRTSG